MYSFNQPTGKKEEGGRGKKSKKRKKKFFLTPNISSSHIQVNVPQTLVTSDYFLQWFVWCLTITITEQFLTTAPHHIPQETWQCLETLGITTTEALYWPLVSEGLRFCATAYTVQRSPSPWMIILPKMSIEPGLKTLTKGIMFKLLKTQFTFSALVLIIILYKVCWYVHCSLNVTQGFLPLTLRSEFLAKSLGVLSRQV